MLTKEDHLVLLGDYIDRGIQSMEVVDFILDMQREGFMITPLTGNHEVMLNDSCKDDKKLLLWMLNDGAATLRSFGIENINELNRKYADFFSSLDYYKIIDNYIFVHAGLNDDIADPFSDRYVMIWESRFSYSNPLLEGKTIIHGHRPKTVAYVSNLIRERSKVIPLDTGCVYGLDSGYGFLSALELNSMTLFSVPCC